LSESEMSEIIAEMKKTLEIKTRQYHGRSYPNCFIGSEAFTWLIENAKLTKCRTPEKAIAMGNYMIHRGVMHHVHNDHLFKNDFLFYQFTKEEEMAVYKWTDKQLLEYAKKIRVHVEIKDRYYHLKKYKECFLGNACVKYLVATEICAHVPEAIALGNALIKQNTIRHVTNSHKFENGPFFYEFVDLVSFDLFNLTPDKVKKPELSENHSSSKPNPTMPSSPTLDFSPDFTTNIQTSINPSLRSDTPTLRESKTVPVEDNDDEDVEEQKELEMDKKTKPIDTRTTKSSDGYLAEGDAADEDEDDNDDNQLYGTYRP